MNTYDEGAKATPYDWKERATEIPAGERLIRQALEQFCLEDLLARWQTASLANIFAK